MVDLRCSGHGTWAGDDETGMCICDDMWSGRDELSDWGNCSISQTIFKILYSVMAINYAILLFRSLYVSHAVCYGRLGKAETVRWFHLFQLSFALMFFLRIVFGVVGDYRHYQLDFIPSFLLAGSSASFVTAMLLLPPAWYATLGPKRNWGLTRPDSEEDMHSNLISASMSMEPFRSQAGMSALGCCMNSGVKAFIIFEWVAVYGSVMAPVILELREEGSGKRVLTTLTFAFISTLWVGGCVALFLHYLVRYRVLLLLGRLAKQQKSTSPDARAPLFQGILRKLRTSTLVLFSSTLLVVLVLPCFMAIDAMKKHTYMLYAVVGLVICNYSLYESCFNSPKTARNLRPTTLPGGYSGPVAVRHGPHENWRNQGNGGGADNALFDRSVERPYHRYVYQDDDTYDSDLSKAGKRTSGKVPSITSLRRQSSRLLDSDILNFHRNSGNLDDNSPDNNSSSNPNNNNNKNNSEHTVGIHARQRSSGVRRKSYDVNNTTTMEEGKLDVPSLIPQTQSTTVVTRKNSQTENDHDHTQDQTQTQDGSQTQDMKHDFLLHQQIPLTNTAPVNNDDQTDIPLTCPVTLTVNQNQI